MKKTGLLEDKFSKFMRTSISRDFQVTNNEF